MNKKKFFRQLKKQRLDKKEELNILKNSRIRRKKEQSQELHIEKQIKF